MSRIIVYNQISLDGFFAGPQGEIDWFIHDPEIDAIAREIYQAETLLFGRVTYQLFKAFWRQSRALTRPPTRHCARRRVSSTNNENYLPPAA